MITLDAFLAALDECAVAPGSRVLAAVSGGADSVALLRLFCAARERRGLTVLCAHVEHGLRGEASREDEAFVRALCAQLGVEMHALNADVPRLAAERGMGLEEAAREARYAFFERTARETGADCVALAHHALDQAETVLLRACRGSDVRGLGAMRRRRGPYVRPLLGFTPQELRDYLVSIGQGWREDATNADPRFSRNRVRLLALPELERACPGAAGALAHLAQAAQRDEDYFGSLLSGPDMPEIYRLANGVCARRYALAALHPALCGRLLVRMAELAALPAPGAEAVDALLAALSREGEGCVNLPGGGEARLGRAHLCVTRPGALPPDALLALSGETDTPYGRFRVRPARPGETGDGVTAQAIPARMLAGAAVSSRRPGERMALFGGGHAELTKLMIAAGIERAMRPSVPILRRGNDVLWAVGLRVGALCAVRGGEAALLAEYLGPGKAEYRKAAEAGRGLTEG